MQQTVVVPLAYSIPQFCDACNISVRHFYTLLKRGEGPETVRMGRRRVITAIAAARYLEEKTEG